MWCVVVGCLLFVVCWLPIVARVAYSSLGVVCWLLSDDYCMFGCCCCVRCLLVVAFCVLSVV